MLEPFYYVDNASVAVGMAQKLLEKEHGEHANDHKRWGVKKIPRPPRPPAGG